MDAPSIGWLKCNTDGVLRGNPGLSTAAFCLRNQEGDLMGAKGFKIKDATNLVDEARAISEGLQYCLDNQLSNIIIETNSLAMVNILNGDWETPRSVSLEVNSIHRIKSLIPVHMNFKTIRRSQVREGRLST